VPDRGGTFRTGNPTLSEDQTTAASPFAAEDGSGEHHVDPIRIEMDKRVDLALHAVMIGFGLVAVYIATGFRLGGYPDPVTARGLPYFTGTYLVVAGLILAARRILTWSEIPGIHTVSEGTDDEPGRPASWVRSFSIIGIAALWAYSLKYLGFIVATPFALFAMIWLMEVRSRAKLILFPLLFTILSWAVFSQILGVILPMGFLSHFARSLGLMP
jgi:hypothetical protein